MLRWLGIPRRLLHKKTDRKQEAFWCRSIDHLDVLHWAHKEYRQRMRLAHPDRGGVAEEAVALNLAWSTVKRRFSKHGHDLDLD